MSELPRRLSGSLEGSDGLRKQTVLPRPVILSPGKIGAAWEAPTQLYDWAIDEYHDRVENRGNSAQEIIIATNINAVRKILRQTSGGELRRGGYGGVEPSLHNSIENKQEGTERTREGVENKQEGTERTREGVENKQEYIEHVRQRFEYQTTREIKSRASQLLEQIERGHLGEMREEVQNYIIEVDHTLAYLAGQLDVLVNGGYDDRLQASVSMTTSWDVIIRRLDDIEEQLIELRSGKAVNSAQQPPPAEATAVGSLLRSLLKAKDDLWDLISGLLTPKEWILKGEAGGFSLAKAAVEIKFGPR